LQRAARTLPIVFASATDPVGGGVVASLARPGGNVTGFTAFEFSMSPKWLELLTEIAPGIKRAAVLRNPTTTGGVGQFSAIQAVAPSLGVELTPLDVRDADEIERTVAIFAQRPNSGLIVESTAIAIVHRQPIIAAADKHRLPAVYPFRLFVTGGGLISYAPDPVDQYRRAAGYVDRILKGENRRTFRCKLQPNSSL
jgi:putative ABC transport system substrate-binding protein